LIDKEDTFEQVNEEEKKAYSDWEIDDICALFIMTTKEELGSTLYVFQAHGIPSKPTKGKGWCDVCLIFTTLALPTSTYSH